MLDPQEPVAPKPKRRSSSASAGSAAGGGISRADEFGAGHSATDTSYKYEHFLPPDCVICRDKITSKSPHAPAVFSQSPYIRVAYATVFTADPSNPFGIDTIPVHADCIGVYNPRDDEYKLRAMSSAPFGFELVKSDDIRAPWIGEVNGRRPRWWVAAYLEAWGEYSKHPGYARADIMKMDPSEIERAFDVVREEVRRRL